MIDLEKFALWHQVSSISYLGPIKFKNLFETTNGNIGEIFKMSESEILELKFINKQIIEGIKKQKGTFKKSLQFIKKQLESAKIYGGNLILLDDKNYPKFLYNSKMCHSILYYKGKIENFLDYDKSIAIVGTRKANKKSLKIAFDTAKILAQKGWIICSGLALGIDSEAHKGALDGNGKTIAVLGCGIDYIYPKENKELYNTIAENNLIVSEFAFKTKPEAWKLQKRNKTIVALSLGAFVVQSKKNGGAMNAVKACKEQKKLVFTISRKGDSEFSGNDDILKKNGIQVDKDISMQIIKYFNS